MTEHDLREQLKEAMRAKEAVRVKVLRGVISEVRNRVIEKRVEDLSEDEVAAVIQREAKQCRETLDFARKGERTAAIAEQEAVLAVLTALLPAQLSEDELREAVGAILAETGATKIGPVMQALAAKYAGRYDGKSASAVVREALAAL